MDSEHPSLRQKIENNLVVWFLGTLLVGFMAGMTTYKAILDIAQLAVVQKSKLDQLQANTRDMAPEAHLTLPASPAQPKESSTQAPETHLTLPSSPAQPKESSTQAPETHLTLPASSAQSKESSTQAPEAQLPAFRISPQFPPFPENFEVIRPGMKLSEARTISPKGQFTLTGVYHVDIDQGQFRSVSYFFNSSEADDPSIYSVLFHFRDDASRQQVFVAVLKQFGSFPHKNQVLGTVLVWPDLRGFQLTIDSSAYRISLASKN
ncbi:MAG: hypothetical protein QOJ16_72 [Acidobacteriota bacterium]|jgi:hypothetical protein|nr:hypothetical protein [Acidobacteriota bacterium]